MAGVVGTLASIASILLNTSPARDVWDINQTRSVTERSILPYCMMMVDGANWVVYASLIDDVFPIGLTNAFGFLAGSTYSALYLRNCWQDKRERVRGDAWRIFAGAVAIIALMVTSAVVMTVVWSSTTAADSIGYFVDLFNVCLYASPLELAWKVLRTRSTSGMYLPLSITIAAAAALWATYGYLTSDWFVAAPQSVGFLAGLAQLSLFLRFGIADNNQPSEGQALEPDGQSGDRSSPPGPGDGAGAGVPAAAAGGGEPGRRLSDGSEPPTSGSHLRVLKRILPAPRPTTVSRTE